MVVDKAEKLDTFMEGVVARNPGEPEFHQAVHEVAMDIIPYMADKPIYKDLRILERMTEPDRVLSFRVVWEDDVGKQHASISLRERAEHDRIAVDDMRALWPTPGRQELITRDHQLHPWAAHAGGFRNADRRQFLHGEYV